MSAFWRDPFGFTIGAESVNAPVAPVNTVRLRYSATVGGLEYSFSGGNYKSFGSGSGGGGPAGVGNELQYRASATQFGALSGSKPYQGAGIQLHTTLGDIYLDPYAADNAVGPNIILERRVIGASIPPHLDFRRSNANLSNVLSSDMLGQIDFMARLDGQWVQKATVESYWSSTTQGNLRLRCGNGSRIDMHEELITLWAINLPETTPWWKLELMPQGLRLTNDTGTHGSQGAIYYVNSATRFQALSPTTATDVLTLFDTGGGILEPRWKPAGVILSGPYVWLTATSGAPDDSELRTNNATPASGTLIAIAELDDNSQDNSGVFAKIIPGDTLYIQKTDDATKWYLYNIDSTGVDVGTYWTFAVTSISVGSAIGNNDPVTVILRRGGAGGGGTGGTGSVRLDQVLDPSANKTFAMSNYMLGFTSAGTTGGDVVTIQADTGANTGGALLLLKSPNLTSKHLLRCEVGSTVDYPFLVSFDGHSSFGNPSFTGGYRVGIYPIAPSSGVLYASGNVTVATGSVSVTVNPTATSGVIKFERGGADLTHGDLTGTIAFYGKASGADVQSGYLRSYWNSSFGYTVDLASSTGTARVFLEELGATSGATLQAGSHYFKAHSGGLQLSAGVSGAIFTHDGTYLTTIAPTTNGYVLTLVSGMPAWVAAPVGALPAGSGSELQYRATATTFGAITNSSVSGANATLGGTLLTRSGLTMDKNIVLDPAGTYTPNAVVFISEQSDSQDGGGDTNPVQILFHRSRGTAASTTNLTDGDRLARIQFNGFLGGWQNFGYLEGLYGNSTTGGIVGLFTGLGRSTVQLRTSTEEIWLQAYNGTLYSRMVFYPAGIDIDGGTNWGVYYRDGSGYIKTTAAAAGFLKSGGASAPAFAPLTATDIGSGVFTLAQGGTGASLADPNADRILFWDDSAGQTTWLSVGTGLAISDTTLSATAVTPTLDQIGNPAASKSFTMSNHTLDFTFAATTGSESVTIQAASGATAGGALLVLKSPNLTSKHLLRCEVGATPDYPLLVSFDGLVGFGTPSPSGGYRVLIYNKAGGTGALFVSGDVRLDVSGAAQGDVYYRDASANTVGLPISGSSGKFLRSDGSFPSWQFISASTDITAGTLPLARGGTGTSIGSAPVNGALLIGNGTNFTPATLTQGAGITVTNGAGTITIAATATTPTLDQVGDPTTNKTFAMSNHQLGWTFTGTESEDSMTIQASGSASAGGALLLLKSPNLTSKHLLRCEVGSTVDYPFIVSFDGLVGFGTNAPSGGYRVLMYPKPAQTGALYVEGNFRLEPSGDAGVRGDVYRRDVNGNITGLHISGSSGKFLKSDGTDPSWQLVSMTDLSGTLPISKGGTGRTDAPTSGQLLIGKADGSYALTTLSDGSNITITEGDGTITISAASGTTPRLDQIQNPTASKTFDMAGFQLELDYAGTVPVTGGLLLDSTNTSAGGGILLVLKNAGSGVNAARLLDCQYGSDHPLFVSYDGLVGFGTNAPSGGYRVLMYPKPAQTGALYVEGQFRLEPDIVGDPGARGDVYRRDVNGNVTGLHISGSSGRFLRSNGTDPSWQLVAMSDLSGTLGLTQGGTGRTDIGGANTFLKSNGSALSYSAVALTTDVSGILPLANGGTGANLTAPGADRILFWDQTGGGVTWLAVDGTSIVITGTTLSAPASGVSLTGTTGNLVYMTGTSSLGTVANAVVSGSGPNLTLGGVLTVQPTTSTTRQIILDPTPTNAPVLKLSSSVSANIPCSVRFDRSNGAGAPANNDVTGRVEFYGLSTPLGFLDAIYLSTGGIVGLFTSTTRTTVQVRSAGEDIVLQAFNGSVANTLTIAPAGSSLTGSLSISGGTDWGIYYRDGTTDALLTRAGNGFVKASTSGFPTFTSQIALGSEVSGTLPITSGGTGFTTAPTATPTTAQAQVLMSGDTLGTWDVGQIVPGTNVTFGYNSATNAITINAASGSTPRLDQVLDPNTSKTFAMGTNTLTFSYTAGHSFTLDATGFSFSTGAAGGIYYKNPGGYLTGLSIGGIGTYLRSGGTAPTWASLNMNDAQTGTLAIARGGTGITTAPSAVPSASQVQVLMASSGGTTWEVGALVPGSNVTFAYNSGVSPKTITIAAVGGSASPGGASGTLQYNNAGAFGGVTSSTVSGANITLGGSFAVQTSKLVVNTSGEMGIGAAPFSGFQCSITNRLRVGSDNSTQDRHVFFDFAQGTSVFMYLNRYTNTSPSEAIYLLFDRGRGSHFSASALATGDYIGALAFRGQRSSGLTELCTLSAQNTASGGQWERKVHTSNTNAVHQFAVNLLQSFSGTPAAGYGQRHTYQLLSASSVVRDAAAMDVKWQVATDATRNAITELRSTRKGQSVTRPNLVLGAQKDFVDNSWVGIWQVQFSPNDQRSCSGELYLTYSVKQTSPSVQSFIQHRRFSFVMLHLQSTNTSAIQMKEHTDAQTGVSSFGGLDLLYYGINNTTDPGETFPVTRGSMADTVTFYLKASHDYSVVSEFTCYWHMIVHGDCDIVAL